VLEDERGKPCDIVRLDIIVFTGKLIQSSIDVEGVPQNDDVSCCFMTLVSAIPVLRPQLSLSSSTNPSVMAASGKLKQSPASG